LDIKMKIGIPLSKIAYTPEAYAYENYFNSLGHKVQLDYELDPSNDVNIYFMGTRPFWKKNKGQAKEIHEYQSLSTPPYAQMKNTIKKLINGVPDGRIFLNRFINHELNFNDNKPFIYRDMGVDEGLFQERILNPEYDILYCGSLSGRIGLIETLVKLSKDYKVIVIGKFTENEKNLLNPKKITLLGPVERKDLPEIYRNTRFGLNYTPDIYPYNIQTSTKTLEYLASGLGVISNKYFWAERFFHEIKYEPIWLKQDNSLNNYELENYKIEYNSLIRNYSWNNVLSKSYIEKFLRVIVNESN